MQKAKELALEGAKLGSLAAFILCNLYIYLVIIAYGHNFGWTDSEIPPPFFVPILVFVTFFHVLVGIILLTSLASLLLGFMLAWLPRPISIINALLMAWLFGFSIVGLVLWLYEARFNNTEFIREFQTREYKLFPAFPCLLFLVFFTWLALKLRHFEKLPEKEPDPPVSNSWDAITYERFKALHQELSTRYEIDLKLLRDGFNPSEIERAWKRLELETAKTRLNRQKTICSSNLRMEEDDIRFWYILGGCVLFLSILTSLLPHLTFWLAVTGGLVGGLYLISHRKWPILATILITSTILLPALSLFAMDHSDYIQFFQLLF